MAKEKLEIEITATDKASPKLQSLSKGLGQLGKLAGGAALAGIGIAATAATTAITGFGAALNIAIDEAMEAQEINTQLEAVLKSTGGVAGLTAEEVNKIAESFQAVTRFEDDAIVAGQTVLLQFTKIGEDTFPRATEAMLDLSTRMGMDLPEAAKLVGKALEGELGTLSRYGIIFDDATKKAIDGLMKTGQTAQAQEIILAKLEQTFGGAAQAAGQTLGGQLDILRNQLLNVAETAGNVLLPALSQALTTLTPYIMQFAQAFADFVQSDQFQVWIQKIIGWLQNDLPQAIKTTSDFWNNQLKPALDAIMPILKGIADLLGVVLPPIMAAFTAGWKIQITVLQAVKRQVDFMITSFKNLLDLIKNAKLPDWLTPGSPTPLELGLRGINDAMSQLNRAALPSFQAQMAGGGIAGGVGMGGGGSVVINYSPGISLGSRAEFESMVVPLIDNAMRSVRRGTI